VAGYINGWSHDDLRDLTSACEVDDVGCACGCVLNAFKRIQDGRCPAGCIYDSDCSGAQQCDANVCR
jgi:hypothetical protein